MENAGLYFIGRCSNPNCTFYNRHTTLYIGKNQTFDFIKERRKCMCGSCYSPITEVLNVLFFSCRWTYCGRLISGERQRSTQEQKTSAFEYFPKELQELPWRWLKFSIGDESGVRRRLIQNGQSQQSSQPNDGLRSTSSVQTDFDTSSYTATHVIDEDLVSTLLATEKVYRQKYRTLKQVLARRRR